MNKFMAIRMFARVAEEASFTAAAAKMGVSISAVTKAVSRLEDELGAQLFTRTTRRISITDYGQLFYERCVAILADLENAEAELKGGTTAARGYLRVLLPFSFGRVTVMPELPRFHARYPEISLEIDFSDEGVDLIAKGYDMAVRTGDIGDSRLTTRVLTRSAQVTVASPAYLARCGTPMQPEDLAAHECIVSRFGPEWRFRRPNAEPFSMRIAGHYRINSGDALREAAVAGLGIIQGTHWLVRKDLESGAVVPILEPFADSGVPVSILYTANRHVPHKVRAFLDFLIQITR